MERLKNEFLYGKEDPALHSEELIVVRTKAGVEKSVKIDTEYADRMSAAIKNIADKENCLDIFKHV